MDDWQLVVCCIFICVAAAIASLVGSVIGYFTDSLVGLLVAVAVFGGILLWIYWPRIRFWWTHYR